MGYFLNFKGQKILLFGLFDVVTLFFNTIQSQNSENYFWFTIEVFKASLKFLKRVRSDRESPDQNEIAIMVYFLNVLFFISENCLVVEIFNVDIVLTFIRVSQNCLIQLGLQYGEHYALTD